MTVPDLQRDSHIPLVRQVVQAIEALIVAKPYAADEPIPSERRLSEQLGVSRTTVRNAISEMVEKDRLYRVPGAGTFVAANGRAAALSMAGYVALSLLEIANPWFAELAQSIQQTLRKHRYDCVLNVTNYSAADEAAFLRRLQRERVVRGLIIAPVVEPKCTTYPFESMRRAGIPFVFVSHFLPDVEADYVVVDGQAGAYEAVDYLARLGHRRIGYLHCAPEEMGHVHKSRLGGYIQAMRDHGLDTLPVAGFVSLHNDMASGYRAMEELLQLTPRPTAVLAFNDFMAFGAFRKLYEVGLRVPNDMSVIGIDNTAMAEAWDVPLTSVDPSPNILGAVAVSVLMHRLEQPDDTRFQRIALRPHLVVRDSCSAPSN